MEETVKVGRINSVIDFGYKAINDEGVSTVELKPTQLIIRDQSPESASAHLAAIMSGVMAPASKQAASE